MQLRPAIRWISDGKIVRLWLARSAGWSDGLDERSFDLVWRGAPKARYTGWHGATGSNLGIFQGLRCVGIYLVFSILFLIKIYILLAWRNSKKTWIVFRISSLFSFLSFFFSLSPLLAHCHWLFIANDRYVQITTDLLWRKNGSPAFGAPAPLTKFFILFYFYFLLCIIIYIYIGKIKNSIQY
jgi:hypothetical protein